MALPHAHQPAVLAGELRRAGRIARGAASQSWIAWASRLGLVIRGIIYFVPGVFALQWAFGRHRQSMTQASAIDVIGRQPMGRVLLVVVALGLAGYAIWGIARAVFDRLNRGHSPAGIAMRVGYAASAIAYLGLLVATLRLLTGSLSHVEQHRDWTVGLLARPYGAMIVVGVGLCWIFGSGITQIVVGWRRSFGRDLMLERMGSTERGLAIGLGRVGLVSRGIVFTIIGVLLVAAARRVPSGSDMGLEGALLELARRPFGHVLLGAAGLGLMVFGVYSAMSARWMRMQGTAAGPGSSPSHSWAS